MYVLAMDTSTAIMGVALTEDTRVLGEVVIQKGQNHAERLLPTIHFLLDKTALTPKDLDLVAVTSGPGSYTGIRIGVSAAKTLAWSLGKPLYSESSLKVLAMNGQRFAGLIVPLFDARRNRVYTAAYRWQGQRLVEVVHPQIVSLDVWLAQLHTFSEPLLFLGHDVERFGETIKENLHELAVFGECTDHLIRPSYLAKLAWQKWKAGEEAEPADFTPTYLQLTQAEANQVK